MQRDVEQLVLLARGQIPLVSLSDTHLRVLLDKCRDEYVCAGRPILEPGQGSGEHVYLLCGEAELHDGDERKKLLDHSGLPVAWQRSSRINVVARSDCRVLRVPREVLDKLLCADHVTTYMQLDVARDRWNSDEIEWRQTVLRSNLFHKVPPLNLEHIFERMIPMPVEDGEVILRQGESGDGCYFIKEGLAVVTRSEIGKALRPQPLATIGIGRCFGEDALLNETVRNATVTMMSKGTLMRLEKQNFLLLLREPAVDTITASELDAAITGGEILLDVRTANEYAQGYLAGAPNLPLDILRLGYRQLNPRGRYVLYCDTGRRSRAAAYLLARKGLRTRALFGGLDSMPATQKQSLLTHDMSGVVVDRGQLRPGNSFLASLMPR